MSFYLFNCLISGKSITAPVQILDTALPKKRPRRAQGAPFKVFTILTEWQPLGVVLGVIILDIAFDGFQKGCPREAITWVNLVRIQIGMPVYA